MSTPQTWLIVGATRGIGLEFTLQLLEAGHHVTATYRHAGNALDALKAKYERLATLQCDVIDEPSIERFVQKLWDSGVEAVDFVVANAGVLEYPNRISEVHVQSSSSFAHHFHKNTMGPLVTAAILLRYITIKTLVFISSDSGSTACFMPHEDGFGAYAASKAALNQGYRHLSAEQSRFRSDNAPCVLALHPGEVSTDMANIEVAWEVPNVIGAKESVRCMLGVIAEKGSRGSGEEKKASLWTWEGVRYPQ